MNRTFKIIFLILQIIISLSILTFCIMTGIESGESLTQLIMLRSTESCIPTALHSLFLFIFGIAFFYVFGKATYPEVSFISISVSFLVFMNLRVFLDLLGDISIVQEILIQRVYYSFWIFSMALLFCSGLFHNGVSYLKQNFFILISICVTVIITAVIPISSGISSIYVFRDNYPLKIIAMLLGLASVFNYIIASIRNNTSTFVLIALGLALFLTGNMMFLYLATPLYLLIAAVLFIAGSIIMIREFYMLHLWS